MGRECQETSTKGKKHPGYARPRTATCGFQHARRKNRRRIALESWANSTKKTGIKQKKIAFKADSVKSIHSVTTQSYPAVSTKSSIFTGETRRHGEQP